MNVNERVKRLQSFLEGEGIDCCLLHWKDPNHYYYSKARVGSGYLVIPARDEPVLLLSPLEEAPPCLEAVKGVPVKKFLAGKGFKRVAYNPEFLTVQNYLRLKRFSLRAINEELESSREVKDEEEQSFLRKAGKAADSLMKEFLDDFHFETMLEARKALKALIASKGLEPSFEPIIASGAAAAIPHPSSNSKVKKGFLIIDFGVKVEGYCSDLTRTFYKGRPSSQEENAYNKVLEVKQECLELCKESAKCEEPYLFAKKNLPFLTHALGHGLGLRIHEKPRLGPRSNDSFKKGHAFTVEPGWYDSSKGIGVRLEDDYLLKNRLEPLTKHSLSLQTI